jgi:two-component system, OmpR family, response regulator QseB
MRILLVEDNARLSAGLTKTLAARGFSVDAVGDLGSASAAVEVWNYDGIILDLGLPDGDGAEWLKRQRTLGEAPPTMIITARGALEDRVAGLDAGADDYLVKPFEVEELAARLRAMMRRPGNREKPLLQHGALTFDPTTRQGFFEAADLRLARREADLLEVLIRQAGRVVTRGALEEAVYCGHEATTPNAVDASVSRLRRTLEKEGGREYLHTIRGVGYMLCRPK